MNRYLLMITIIALSFCSSSCKKFLEIPPPETEAELSKIFNDDKTALSAAIGVYSRIASDVSALCNGSVTIYAGLSSDEISNTGVNTNDDAFRTNNLLSNSSVVLTNFWRNAYLYIYHCNAVIEGLDQPNSVSSTLKMQLRGEMLYLRALHYFYLVNLFGSVPLQTTTNYLETGTMPRTNEHLVWQQITDDLIAAVSFIPVDANSDNSRVSKAAAQGLLARVYLYRGMWKEAEASATAVIDNSRFSLESLNNVFIIGSREILFSWARITGNTVEGSKFLPTSATARPPYNLLPGFLSIFETGDKRKIAWIKNNTIGGITYSYPNKYKIRLAMPISERYAIQRLAEIYLIRSEAKANMDNLSAAIDDLDIIRNRAGLPKLKIVNPGIGKSDLIVAIWKERQVELFAEWGHRWLDLKRTGQADKVIGALKGENWQPADKLYPIPFAEIQTNPNLQQNPGYN